MVWDTNYFFTRGKRGVLQVVGPGTSDWYKERKDFFLVPGGKGCLGVTEKVIF